MEASSIMEQTNNETCGWRVSVEQPECGAKAVHRVRVRNRITDATVWLCNKHLAKHNENFASMRNAS